MGADCGKKATPRQRSAHHTRPLPPHLRRTARGPRRRGRQIQKGEICRGFVHHHRGPHPHDRARYPMRNVGQNFPPRDAQHLDTSSGGNKAKIRVWQNSWGISSRWIGDDHGTWDNRGLVLLRASRLSRSSFCATFQPARGYLKKASIRAKADMRCGSTPGIRSTIGSGRFVASLFLGMLVEPIALGYSAPTRDRTQRPRKAANAHRAGTRPSRCPSRLRARSRPKGMKWRRAFNLENGLRLYQDLIPDQHSEADRRSAHWANRGK
jgi:hypothetical protein